MVCAPAAYPQRKRAGAPFHAGGTGITLAAFALVDSKKDQTVSDGDTKRKALRKKVDEAQAELARPAPPEAAPPEGIRALAMDYPFAMILGGVALGAVAGALIPRAAGRRLTQGALAAATVAGELGLAYGKHALEATGEAAASASKEGRQLLSGLGERIEDLSGTVGQSATHAGKRAADAAGEAAEVARDVGMRIAQQVIRLITQARP